VKKTISKFLNNKSRNFRDRKIPKNVIYVIDVFDHYNNIYHWTLNSLNSGDRKQYIELKDYYTRIQDYEMLAAVVKAKDDFDSLF